MDKTIVAISTPIANGAISIIRMSGDNALNIAKDVFFPAGNDKSFEPRKMYLGNFKYNDTFDKCMCVYFKKPYSYTGEDVIEFQCHGGITLTNKIFESLVSKGATPAGKGDFSKLAFLNGKLSLDEAEGIIDMINAESESELKAGYDLVQGKLKNQVVDIQAKLTEILAKLEVTLDYPEEDLEIETKQDIKLELNKIKNNLINIASSSSYGSAIKNGTRICIYGKTNAGKSSLLNSLLGIDRAIVTDIQGTTRDVLEETFIHNGYKFILMDTAGIRETEDFVENIGINKSKESLKVADIILFVVDGSEPLDENDFKIAKELSDKNTILIVNKCDKNIIADISKLNLTNTIEVSTKDEINIDKLKERLLQFVTSKNTNNNMVVITNTRHLDALNNAIKFTEITLDNLNENIELDLISIDIKNIWLALGDITGNSDNEKIIDEIFSKFCVGK